MIETIKTCTSLGWPDVVARIAVVALIGFVVKVIFDHFKD